MAFQELVALGIVLAAAGWLLLRSVRAWRLQRQKRCGGCSTCEVSRTPAASGHAPRS